LDLFRIGAHFNLKPDEVLDMSLDVFQAYIQGCDDRILDEQLLAAQSGYWAAYFQSKHPKSLSKILEDIRNDHDKPHQHKQKHKSEVDVDAFLKMEEQFKERKKRNGGGING
jgi:hypothetical protein